VTSTTTTTAGLVPFTVHVPDAELADLQERLRRTRWPEPETEEGWVQGAPLEAAKALAAHWADGYDWRATEARINAFPQYRVEIDGLGVHVLHVRSPHPDAVPLLVTHGWPGSFVEQLDILSALANPPDPADAFHVVCPSLPGFGFSDKPSGPGWGVPRVAAAWTELMDRLGYSRFAVHGGDWGSYVSATLGLPGVGAPERLVGIHLTMPVAAKPDEDVPLSERDKGRLGAAYAIWKDDSGYAAIQSTRPQTLGYGLTDSPAGQLAWVAEKFWKWADHDGDVEKAIPRDRILDTVSLHWFARTAASSARLYWESYQKVPTDQVHVPVGCSIFPGNSWMPQAWCERRFTDLRYWRDLDAGGHFPALEVPDVLVDELRTFFRGLR
jgi:epoxide hydrolase